VADQIGAPTWAREVADATARMVRQACRERERGAFTSGVFNVTAAGATSWCGFAEAILDQTMSRPGVQRDRPKIHPISSLEYAQRAVRPKNSRLTGDRLRERFSIALPDWKQALALCMQEELPAN
jgi:dTDP-4-dehydrorhamnose reductase